MNFKKFFAAAAACAVAAFSTVAMTVSAAETELTYTGPSENAFAINDDGSTLRLNLLNEWSKGKETADVAKSGSFSESINVTFTISGLKGGCNVNEDGSNGDPYYAELVGSIGEDNYWGTSDPSKNTVTNDQVSITGDGQYTASFKLAKPADTILCLILTTNINAFNYASDGKPANTGITIKVDKVTTGGAAVTPDNNTQTPTQAPADNNNTQTPTQAQANNNNNAQTPTQAANGTSGSTSGGSTSGGAVLGNSTQTNSASTGDAGVAAAVAGLVITAGIGAAAVAMRSRKK